MTCYAVIDTNVLVSALHLLCQECNWSLGAAREYSGGD